MCSLRFENNLLTIEGVASLRLISPLSKLWFPFVSLALPLLVQLALFSNDSGLKTGMLCLLSPIYRYMLINTTFCLFLVNLYGCVYNRNKLFYWLLFTVYCTLVTHVEIKNSKIHEWPQVSTSREKSM